MESIRLFMCALLLTPVVALAQAEELEEVPADETAPAEMTAEEDAPAETAPDEAVSADDAAEGDTAETDEPAKPRGGHHVDVFYTPTSEIDLSGTVDLEERGDGFGVRALYRVMDHYAVSGEYQSLKLGDADEIERTEMRLGLGFVADGDEGDFFGLFVQRDDLASDEIGDLDGYSVHARLSAMRSEWLGFYGDLGYLRLESDAEKYSGNELTVGVLFKIGQFGIFADARRTALDGKDSGSRRALADVRTGVRYEFGEIKGP